MFSCQDNGQDDLPGISELVVQDPLYEEKLKELSLYFGEVFRDNAAMEELFNFSKTEENFGEVNVNLKQLFEQGYSEAGKTQQSAIVNAFYSNKEANYRSDDDTNFDDFVAFIKDNNISITAPYLAEKFEMDKIKNLTISWWTKEMELAHIDDLDWKGETPGFVYL